MKSYYNEKLLRMILTIGSMYYLLLAFYGDAKIRDFVGDRFCVVLYIVFAVAGIYVGMDRDFYLPFLGDAVFPDGLFPPRITPMSANMNYTLKGLPVDTKVIYWAAEPCEKTQTCNVERMPWESYNDYTNTGTTMSDNKGNASISIRGTPQSYNVPYKDELIMPHFHYRYKKMNGMYSKVHTQYI